MSGSNWEGREIILPLDLTRYHTYATERVGLISIEELRSLMGHESIQTTLRYQKFTSQKAESAARHALNMLINPQI
jgi:integrase/recombinase XerD